MVKLSDLNIYDIGTEIQLIGAVYQGKGKTILVPTPGETIEGEFETLEMDRDEWKTFMRQSDIIEVEMFERAGDNRKIVKGIARKTARQVDQNVSWAVFRRDQFRCRYCGADQVPMTVDHLVTWEELGPSTEENLLTSCKKCNRTRGNMSYPDWLKSPYYKRVSRNVSAFVREDNQAILDKLDQIPRRNRKKSR